jgi:ferric-dicitrate binding protein FerR (iron transport regulator)
MDTADPSPRQRGALRTLSRRLRRLRCLEPPEDLQARLMARIPHGPAPSSAPRRSGTWRVWGGAAAGAVLLVVAVLGAIRIAARNTNPSLAGAAAGTSVHTVLPASHTPATEETRPCDIMPPLPNWH